MAEHGATGPQGHVPLRTKLAFGFGTVAFGIKDNGFAVFLLFFYNQVVGLPAEMVGATIGLALLFDAVTDPLVGNLSDRTKTRIGRRHPWMYGSAVPIAIAWLLLWNPPDAGTWGTLGYLLATGMLVRATLCCYEVPSISLLPELTTDYQERTKVLRYRFLFGWIGGLFMLAVAYGLIFVDTAEFRDGRTNPAGYPIFALIGALLMFTAVMVSAMGTHRLLAKPSETKIETAESLSEILGTFRYRPFLILMLAALFGNANQGITFALTNYLYGYIWEFSSIAFLGYTGILFASAVAAFLVIVPLGRRLRKQRAAAVAVLVAVAFGSAPYWLRLIGLAPENGSPALIPFIYVLTFVGNTGAISAMIFTTSMMADITDHAAKAGGKRTEGLFFAGYFFLQKSISGLGIFLTGLILGMVGFPENAEPGTVSEPVLNRLTLFYAFATLCFGIAAAWSFLRFPLGPVSGDDPEADKAAKDLPPELKTTNPPIA